MKNLSLYLKLIFLSLLILPSASAMEQTPSALGQTMIIGTPRSATTVLLRYWHNLSDSVIAYNEPANPVYYKSPITDSLYKDNRLESYDAITQEISSKQRAQKNVAIKEVSFIAQKLLESQPQLYDAFDHFVVLINHPYEQALSLYEKVKDHFAFINFSDLLGQEALVVVLKELQARVPEKLVIVLADQLMANPRGTINAIHQKFGQSFDESKMNWPALNFKKDPRWLEYKVNKVARSWHDKAFQSTGFISRAVREPAMTFETIPVEHRETVKAAVEANLAHYERILREFASVIKEST